MTDFVSEQLLGYLLGALDDTEQECIQERLDGNPELRGRLEHIRRSLDPMAATKIDVAPPAGLADRTCRFVASRPDSAADSATESPLPTSISPLLASSFEKLATCRTIPAVSKGPAASERYGPAEPAKVLPNLAETAPLERSGRWSWQDITVTAAIVLAAGALVFPAIQSSRFNARVAACQDNLRELGTALCHYSDRNHGYFPRVPERGPLAVAGIYAPTLVSDGFLGDNRSVVCPASPLAEDSDYEVATLEVLNRASPEERFRMLPTLGGSYGYSLGYTDGSEYHHTKNLGRRHFALMADVPNPERPAFQSDNHGGVGQNVLFEDGHVKFLTSPRPVDQSDHIYTNANGQPGPGNFLDDAVVVPSAFSPAPGGGR